MFHVGLRTIFYLAIVPGLLAFVMVLLVTEHPVAVAAKSKIDVNLRRFPRGYWRYLLVIALFGLGNSSNAFLILRTQDIGASLETTILILRGVQSGGGSDLPIRPARYPTRWGGRPFCWPGS